jgi:hypothetical protein
MSDWNLTSKKRSVKSLTLFPGMVLLREDGQEVLVGNVNPSGGRCDCCYDYARNIVAWKFLPGYTGEVEEDPYGTNALEDEE